MIGRGAFGAFGAASSLQTFTHLWGPQRGNGLSAPRRRRCSRVFVGRYCHRVYYYSAITYIQLLSHVCLGLSILILERLLFCKERAALELENARGHRRGSSTGCYGAAGDVAEVKDRAKVTVDIVNRTWRCWRSTRGLDAIAEDTPVDHRAYDGGPVGSIRLRGSWRENRKQSKTSMNRSYSIRAISSGTPRGREVSEKTYRYFISTLRKGRRRRSTFFKQEHNRELDGHRKVLIIAGP